MLLPGCKLEREDVNVLDQYTVVPQVTVPVVGSSHLAHRGHYLVRELQNLTPDAAIKLVGQELYEQVKLKLEHGYLLDLDAAGTAVQSVIDDLEAKKKDGAGLNPQQTAFLKLSMNKSHAAELDRAEKAGATAADVDATGDDTAATASSFSKSVKSSRSRRSATSTHSAARCIPYRRSERSTDLIMALLARFYPVKVMDKLVVLDACCGSGSVARALLELRRFGISSSCVSVDVEPLVLARAQQSYVSAAQSRFLKDKFQNQRQYLLDNAACTRKELRLMPGSYLGTQVRHHSSKCGVWAGRAGVKSSLLSSLALQLLCEYDTLCPPSLFHPICFCGKRLYKVAITSNGSAADGPADWQYEPLDPTAAAAHKNYCSQQCKAAHERLVANK